MSVLQKTYGKSLDEDVCDIYFTMLTDIPDQLGYQAALKCLSENNFFPTIAELRKASANIGTHCLPSPEEAWNEAHSLVRYVGNYGIPEFSHPLIKKAVDTMGWRELCFSENPSIDRAQFIKIYSTYRQREVNELITPESVKALGKSLSLELAVVSKSSLPKEVLQLGQSLSMANKMNKQGRGYPG